MSRPYTGPSAFMAAINSVPPTLAQLALMGPLQVKPAAIPGNAQALAASKAKFLAQPKVVHNPEAYQALAQYWAQTDSKAA